MANKGEIIAKVDPNSELIASIPKDQLRSLFYLFSGKPDSRIKVYDSPVHINRKDVIELNQSVIRKLQLHNIDATTTSVKVGYVDSNMQEFGTWAEFESHHWQEPERIEEIVIKWDFLVTITNYVTPQRHTLLFRISNELKPGKVLQMLASGNSDEFDQLDMFASPAFCRVDFINALLSRELVNLISEWYAGRKSPVMIPQNYYWFKQKRRYIAEFLDHWTILSWVLLVASIFYKLAEVKYSFSVPIHIAALAVFLGIYSIRPISRISNILANFIYQALSKLEGSRVVFEFTSGDAKRISELQTENLKQGKSFLWSSFWNISLNIISTGIAFYLHVGRV